MMIKPEKTDLISYLPPFLAEYKELNSLLKAEEPEFEPIIRYAETVLYNQFIATADETGLKRFETMMKLYPDEKEEPEMRRERVQSKWLSKLPYTIKMLEKQIETFCGNYFTLSTDYENYGIKIITHLDSYSRLLALRERVNNMLPLNMKTEYLNFLSIQPEKESTVFVGVKQYGKHKKIKVAVNRY